MGTEREDDEAKLDLGTPVTEEPEPDWAEEIRRLRRERGDRLRSMFAEGTERPGREP